MKFRKVLKKSLNLIKRGIVVIKYNQYNRANYFRKQGAQIGDDCYLAISSLGDEPFLIKIGNHVGIATGVKLLTHDLGWSFRDRMPDLQVFGKIEIGDNCNIGTGAIILPNVKIGDNCIISAGAIVTKDIPSNSVAAGVPARVVSSFEDYYQKTRRIWLEQKPKGYMKELEQGKHYPSEYLGKLKGKAENRSLLKNHLIKLFWEDEKQ